MAAPPASRLVRTALRCYPARWRRRHGDEAAELAALLIRDGTAPSSIAWSYLAGAAREWLTPHPGRRLSAGACALAVAVCSLGASAGLLASAMPARAASTAKVARVASTSRAHPQCRPAPAPAPAPVALRATGHQPASIWEANDQPC